MSYTRLKHVAVIDITAVRAAYASRIRIAGPYPLNVAEFTSDLPQSVSQRNLKAHLLYPLKPRWVIQRRAGAFPLSGLAETFAYRGFICSLLL
jgi:hypothetical protein